MSEKPTWKLSVILERVPTGSPWETHRWQLAGVVPDVGGEPRVIREAEDSKSCLFPGLEVAVHRDEAEGYYLNVSSPEPCVFVSLRTDEGSGDPYPFQATLSYNEAARWMDGGEKVDRTAAWPELVADLGAWVEANYRPEPKKRQRPKSFEGKEGRLRERG